VDTRSKIVSIGAVRASGAVAVAGYFDVLTGDLVRQLRAIRDRYPGTPFAAVVLPDPDALLGHRARAELAAALAVIDYVLITEIEDSEALGFSVIHLEEADRERNRRLREHVRARHGV
jgi:hypothetical protein